jgi:DNA repair protein RadC
MFRVPVYKVQLVRDGSCKMKHRSYLGAADAVELFRTHVGDADREHFAVIMLDIKNRFLGIHTVSVGMIDGTLAHPREVFKPAILTNADSLVLAHNHPSGDVEPSDDDIELTYGLLLAGELMGIRVRDHVVVGRGKPGYTSFLARGLLKIPTDD